MEPFILSHLNHPNILRQYDVVNTDSYLFLILEYAEFGDFYDLLKVRGQLSEREAKFYFLQLIEGVEYLH